MLRGQSETRMIWLMSLMIVAISAWFLSFPLLTYVCGFALLMSVMHYVDAIQQPAQALGEQRLIAFRATSKVPLYLSSIIAVVGGLLDWGWMIAAGAAAWIFFFCAGFGVWNSIWVRFNRPSIFAAAGFFGTVGHTAFTV